MPLSRTPLDGRRTGLLLCARPAYFVRRPRVGGSPSRGRGGHEEERVGQKWVGSTILRATSHARATAAEPRANTRRSNKVDERHGAAVVVQCGLDGNLEWHQHSVGEQHWRLCRTAIPGFAHFTSPNPPPVMEVSTRLKVRRAFEVTSEKIFDVQEGTRLRSSAASQELRGSDAGERHA